MSSFPLKAHAAYARHKGRLTERQVLAIRRSRQTHAALVRRYQIDPKAISDIRAGLAYKWVQDPRARVVQLNLGE